MQNATTFEIYQTGNGIYSARVFAPGRPTSGHVAKDLSWDYVCRVVRDEAKRTRGAVRVTLLLADSYESMEALCDSPDANRDGA